MLLRAFLLLFLIGSLGAATTNDPSEEFVAAYRSFKEAERLDQSGRKEEAIAKYRYAENHLINISNNYPNWQKQVVEYRLSKIKNNLGRITNSSTLNEQPSYGNDPSQHQMARSFAVQDSDNRPEDQQERGDSLEGNRNRAHDVSDSQSVETTHTAGSPEAEIIESTTQNGAKRVSDNPTLSIIPPASKSGSASSRELLQLQKQLKKTEAALEKAQSDIVDKTAELDQSKVSLVETKAQLAKTERQIADLKSDLEKNRAGSLQRETALKKSLEQLEGKVTALSADKEVIMEENSHLQQNLQEATSSLTMALGNKNRLEQLQVEVNTEKNASASLHEQLAVAQRERDKAHAESAALAQQIKEVSDSLVGAQKKNHELEALQAQASKLEQQLQESSKALADAQQKNQEIDSLKAQLTTLTTEHANKEKIAAEAEQAHQAAQTSQENLIAELQKKLAQSQADQESLKQERNNIETQLKAATGEVALLKKSGADATALQHQVEELTQKLEKNKNQIAGAQTSEMEVAASQKKALSDLEGKLHLVTAEKETITAQKQELEQQLTTAHQKIQSLMSQAPLDVATLQTSLQQSQAELKSTKTQLETSEKKIAALEKAEPEKERYLQDKEKELAAAREEAGKLQKALLGAQQQLASIQEELKTKDDRYSELKKQLDQKNEELAALQKKAHPEPGQEKAVAENELLKGIVLRELKAEARRQQLKKLVMEDLEKLKVKSDTVSLQLKKLARPVKLTPEERALFKDKLPLSSEVEQDEERLIVSVEASKNGLGTNTTTSIPATNLPTGGTPTGSDTNAVTTTNLPTGIKAPTEGEGKPDSTDQDKQHAVLNKAKEQFEHQNYAQAEKSFQEALATSPNDYMVLSNLGVVEFQLGKMGDAETILKRACAQEPKKSFAFTTLGIVHYRQERFDDAEKVLRQAVAINDQDFTAHNYLGIVLAASGKNKAGESEIMKSIEINPSYADAHFNLAVIYATGKPPAKEMAKKHYKKAVSLGAPADQALEKLID